MKILSARKGGDAGAARSRAQKKMAAVGSRPSPWEGVRRIGIRAKRRGFRLIAAGRPEALHQLLDQRVEGVLGFFRVFLIWKGRDTCRHTA